MCLKMHISMKVKYRNALYKGGLLCIGVRDWQDTEDRVAEAVGPEADPGEEGSNLWVFVPLVRQKPGLKGGGAGCTRSGRRDSARGVQNPLPCLLCHPPGQKGY